MTLNFNKTYPTTRRQGALQPRDYDDPNHLASKSPDNWTVDNSSNKAGHSHHCCCCSCLMRIVMMLIDDDVAEDVNKVFLPDENCEGDDAAKINMYKW